MTEKVKEFLEYIETRPEIKKELNAKNDAIFKAEDEKARLAAAVDHAIAIASKHGFSLTVEDFEIADYEPLDKGGFCICYWAGAGGGTLSSGAAFGCACVIVGGGGDGTIEGTVCACGVTGTGDA